MTPPPAVVAIIPAHNEAGNIAATLASLRHQTQPPNRILVVADSCTDDTVRIDRADGAQVNETAGNTAKKAGALIQGLAAVLPSLRGTATRSSSWTPTASSSRRGSPTPARRWPPAAPSRGPT